MLVPLRHGAFSLMFVFSSRSDASTFATQYALGKSNAGFLLLRPTLTSRNFLPSFSINFGLAPYELSTWIS